MYHTEVLCLSSEAMIYNSLFLVTSCSHVVMEFSIAIVFADFTVVLLLDDFNHLVLLARNVSNIASILNFMKVFMASHVIFTLIALLCSGGATCNLFNLTLLLEYSLLVTFVKLIKRHKCHLILLIFASIYSLRAWVLRRKHITLRLERHG